MYLHVEIIKRNYTKQDKMKSSNYCLGNMNVTFHGSIQTIVRRVTSKGPINVSAFGKFK